MLFKKNDYIKFEDDYFICIVCDEEYAVFGNVIHNNDCFNTDFENTFIVSNDESVNKDMFEYQKVTIDEIVNN